MVDIHSHILPGLDDGAQTMEDSLEMLRIAAASGTTDIVATPHANSEFAFDPKLVKSLCDDLGERARGLINIHSGCDFHVSFENLQDALQNPEKFTINHRRYLMVELPDMVALPPMRSAMQRLLNARISPIITHPERNPSLQGRLQDLHQWVQDGCLLQITGQSLLGRFGASAQRAADYLLSANLVHFIASDAHDTQDRTPDLSEPYRYISEHYGPARANLLFTENPAAALWGESTTLTAQPRPGRLSRFFAKRR